MTLYLDTSVVVALLVVEAGTARVRDWLAGQTGPMIVSDWVSTEVAAALAGKVRSRQMDAVYRAKAQGLYALMLARRFASVAVAETDFREAGDLAARSRLPLRAADALHLAIASRMGATLATADLQQGAAGPPLRVPTVMV